jgi:hypothetical protein
MTSCQHLVFLATNFFDAPDRKNNVPDHKHCSSDLRHVKKTEEKPAAPRNAESDQGLKDVRSD